MTIKSGRGWQPALVGHRGAAGLAPENTLPSIRLAAALGVEWIEVDVRLTADGHAILLHDEGLERTTTGAGSVSGVALEHLRALEVRFVRPAGPPGAPSDGGAFTGTRVPTLEEALVELGDATGCLIELKRDDAREGELVAAVVAAVTTAGLQERVRLISFRESLLAEASRQAPHFRRGIIGGRELKELFAPARRQECVAIHPNLRLVAEDTAQRCAHAGLRLNAWTANDAAEIRRLATFHVDEITTDFPDLARQVLGVTTDERA